jgi:GNAT superfamily N-acetyltransferase
MQSLKLRYAEGGDIPLISALARKIWMQYYPAIISLQQIDYMLGKMYSAESLKEQMESKGDLFILVYFEDRPEGFISVNERSQGEFFLSKFYVNQEMARKGIGAEAFSQLVRMLTPVSFSLTVNRRNYKSINFYFKLGFVIREIADFDIGEGYEMNDFVMSWQRRD